MQHRQQQQQHHPDQTAFHHQPQQQAASQVASSSHLGSNRAIASAPAPVPVYRTSAKSAMSGLDQTPKKGDFNIQLQQATPTHSSSSQQQQHNMSNLPNTLLPGASSSSRPPTTATTYSAPQTIPTMPPPINTNQQQYTPRPPTLNSQHSHSRSSPAGLDQKYIAFSTTPTKGYNSVTPSSSHSPLGLADIRPRTNSDLLNRHGGQSTAVYDYPPSQTNCSYMAPWAAYSFDWCKWPVPNGNSCGKMAIGSYLEDPHNFIQIVDTQIAPQDQSTMGGPAYGIDYVKVAEATCAYPVTRISWEPPSSSKQSTDLLATSGDHLRLWSLPSSSQPAMLSNNINRSASVNMRDPPTQKLQPLALLSNSKTPEHTAPLTSLDWNTLSPKLIITSSIDTTCTIWDIPTLTAKTQLIAHDKEVFDVRFCAGSVDVFVSCGADGSVRMFDLRSLEHSTIIYEPSEKSDKDKAAMPASPTKSSAAGLPASPPLLRLAASPHDAHLLATFAAESNIVRILDARQPGTALLELRGHSAALNSIEWNPSRRGMLASGGDDSQVLVWDLLNSGNGASLNGGGAQGEAQAKGPSASWRSDYEVNNISWAPQSALTGQGGDWLGVCAGKGVWGVKL
ncbi:WD40 repeat-like protein [Aureobasidium sp. EXF-3400]|nr:WD40 repeat-like protein [Aureobasidium sp. EXF-12344]KAI4785020.1 WD40 repeat-like protein [Aureobasidium sp. EXF-3400]